MREVVIVDAVRTPMGRWGGALAGVRPDDMAAHVIASLVERNAVDDEPHRRRLLGRRQPGRRGQPQRRPHGGAAGRATGGGSRCDRQPAVRLGSGGRQLRLPSHQVRRGRPRDRRGLGVDDPRSFRHGQVGHSLGAARPRCTTRRSAGASSTRAWHEAYGSHAMGETAEIVGADHSISREEQDAFALTATAERSPLATRAGSRTRSSRYRSRSGRAILW